MTPIAADLMAKAKTSLEFADTILKAGIAMVAAREAYMAAFHAAQALLHDRDGKVPKTHSGVRAQFARIALADASLGEQFGRFLARAYEYKDISDYRTDRPVTQVEAADVIERANAFVDAVAKVLT